MKIIELQKVFQDSLDDYRKKNPGTQSEMAVKLGRAKPFNPKLTT